MFKGDSDINRKFIFHTILSISATSSENIILDK